MIDEKKLIDNLKGEWEELCDYSENVETLLEYVIKFIGEQPKIGDWTPCSERLPEEGQLVLATHEGGVNPERQVIEHMFKDGQFICNWDMDTKFGSPTFGQHYMGDVIAWKPLPDPYRE